MKTRDRKEIPRTQIWNIGEQLSTRTLLKSQSSHRRWSEKIVDQAQTIDFLLSPWWICKNYADESLFIIVISPRTREEKWFSRWHVNSRWQKFLSSDGCRSLSTLCSIVGRRSATNGNRMWNSEDKVPCGKKRKYSVRSFSQICSRWSDNPPCEMRD